MENMSVDENYKDNFKEIFSRLQKNDEDKNDFNNKLLRLQEHIDKKVSEINVSLLKIVGSGNNRRSTDQIPIDQKSGDSSWVRVTVVAITTGFTVIGFFITALYFTSESSRLNLNAATDQIQQQISFQDEYIKQIREEVTFHSREKWHEGAAMSIARQEQKLIDSHHMNNLQNKRFQRLSDKVDMSSSELLDKIDSIRQTNKQIKGFQ